MTDNFKKLFPNEFDTNPRNKNRFKDYYSNVLDEMSIKVKPRRKLRYISLFTGIGGFEVAIQTVFPNAECIAYSEVKKHALKVYTEHFPEHTNLGDVSSITKEQIQDLVREKGCDLIVGGFPCTNLTSFANIKGNTEGLNGPKSGLFWKMCDIIEWVKEINPNIKLLAENNGSMKKEWKDIITEKFKELVGEDIKLNHVNSKSSWVQIRNRIYWTNIKYMETISNLTLLDILEPIEKMDKEIRSEKFIECGNRIWKMKIDKEYNSVSLSLKDDNYIMNNIKTVGGKSRWSCGMHSDTIMENNIENYIYPIGKAKPITSGGGGISFNHVILDRRVGNGKIMARIFTDIEMERLFLFPDKYTNYISKSGQMNVLGNTVIIYIILGFIRNL